MRKFVKELLNKRLNNEKGLTLIELLAVIVILGIIAAIAVPAIGGIIDNSKYSATKADAINAINAAKLYYLENSSDTSVTVKELKDQKFLESKGNLTDAMTISSALQISGTTVEFKTGSSIKFNSATLDDINKTDASKADANNPATDPVAITP